VTVKDQGKEAHTQVKKRVGIKKGVVKMTEDVYDFICSIGELIDKLSIENIKCYDVNRKVLEERKKKNPDPRKIAEWEFNARKAGELRVKLKTEINKRLAEALARGKIGYAPEARTYSDQMEKLKDGQ